MECPYCGAENRAGTRYCGHCGRFIGSPQTAPNSGAVSTTGSNPAVVSRSLAPGSRLQGGRYIVKQTLGQGGMGTALLATDNRLDGKSVVIKELISENTDPAKQQEDVRNFKREVATLAHIDHPLVPNVTDHFQEGTRYFMVQEYVEGENLEDRIDRVQQPLKERDMLVCASEILDVLDYLSQQTPPIVHRDIKPANIIIGTKDKRAHLVDFGIARAELTRNAQRKQTSALGTPGYAPPEQYQGNADPRSDLYALAATLHHLLTNRDPRNHPPFTYPPARTLNPQLSPETERLLTHALNNDINQRYQSASAMKQEVDAILRQRFGISGNIDSYTLGTLNSNTSGSMNTVQATGVSAANMPTFVTPTPVVASMTPVQPLAQLNQPVGPGYPPAPPFQQPPTTGLQRRRRPGWLIPLLILLLLLILGAGGYAALHLLHPSSAITNGIGVTKVGNEYIGISDGTFAFDTTLPDGSLKTQAANALKANSNDTNTALSDLNQALSVSINDPEALIYKEDLRVVNSQSPYVTLVVATMLTGPDSSVGFDDLQGAYVAQKEFNDGQKLSGGVQVRLLIANSGSTATNSQTVARQIVQLAQSDKTFVGVMGWPFSDSASAVISILAAAHIPMISQTASTDSLTHASPYFFRVAPSNTIQASEGAKYAEQTLHATKVALFVDPNNLYSQTLAQDFANQFKTDGYQVIDEEHYTVNKPSTLPTALNTALAKNPDMLYFAGYANDLSTLLVNIPANNPIPVMGGDALYELGGYGSNARASGFTHLHFTAFSYPDEWDIQGLTTQKPTFFNEYKDDYDPNNLNPGAPYPYGYVRTDSDVMLSYDATLALLDGCNIALTKAKGSTITPQQLRDAIATITGSNAIQGVSGQISFGSDGNPIDKAVVVLNVHPDGTIHMEQAVLGQFLKES